MRDGLVNAIGQVDGRSVRSFHSKVNFFIVRSTMDNFDSSFVAATPTITPTSYGAVISQVGSDRRLLRVYLNKDAVIGLTGHKGDSYKSIMKVLAAKGINIDSLTTPIDPTLQHDFPLHDIDMCDQLVQKNGWLLFSLYPLQISIQTVNYCNAKCDFCYGAAPSIESMADKSAIAPEKVYALKDYAAPRGVKIGLSGGEPTLHPKIYELLEYRNEEIFDTLITNLTPHLDLKRLIATGVDLIQVSMHGYGAFHDKTIGISGAYRKVKGRIFELIPELNMATNTVVTPDNMSTIEALVNDLNGIQEETGRTFSYVRFVPVLPSGTGYHRYTVKMEFMDTFKMLLTKLMGEYSDLEFEVPMLHPNPYEYFCEHGRCVCPAGATVCAVKVDGRVVPCNQFMATDVCTESGIDQKSFDDIWVNDPLLSKMRKGRPYEPSEDTDKTTWSECAYLYMKELGRL